MRCTYLVRKLRKDMLRSLVHTIVVEGLGLVNPPGAPRML